MEIVDLIAVLCFTCIMVTGIALKRHTKRLLSNVDGLGEVKTSAQADSEGIEL